MKRETERNLRRRICLLCLSVVVLHLSISTGARGTSTSVQSIWTISALTTPENVGTEQYCREVFNETHQVALCENSPKVASTIIQGTKRAIRQLQADFKQCKWNATTFHGKHLFGSFLLESNRERAAVSAYTFLGPVKSLAEGCHEQKFENCQCEKKPSVTNGDGETTDFDCAELVEWPNMTMQRYTKGRRQSTPELTDLVDDHNEQVGARLLEDRNFEKCICHGISGSCTKKTCYTKTPDLVTVGSILKRKYREASQVKLSEDNKLVTLHGGELLTDTLVYVQSTDLCEDNPNGGLLGTSGRECSLYNVQDSCNQCEALCCGGNYDCRNEEVPVEEEECCEFVWCCRIECGPCANATVTPGPNGPGVQKCYCR